MLAPITSENELKTAKALATVPSPGHMVVDEVLSFPPLIFFLKSQEKISRNVQTKSNGGGDGERKSAP